MSCDNIPSENGPLTFSNSCGFEHTVQQPTVNDNYNICGGYREIVWSGIDDCGRNYEYTQNINLLPSVGAVYLNPVSDITISCDDVITLSPLLDYDNGLNGDCQINGTSIAMITGSDTCGGQLIYKWTFTDSCNREISHIQQISIKERLDDGPLCSATTRPGMQINRVDSQVYDVIYVYGNKRMEIKEINVNEIVVMIDHFMVEKYLLFDAVKFKLKDFCFEAEQISKGQNYERPSIPLNTYDRYIYNNIVEEITDCQSFASFIFEKECIKL